MQVYDISFMKYLHSDSLVFYGRGMILPGEFDNTLTMTSVVGGVSDETVRLKQNWIVSPSVTWIILGSIITVKIMVLNTSHIVPVVTGRISLVYNGHCI